MQLRHADQQLVRLGAQLAGGDHSHPGMAAPRELVVNEQPKRPTTATTSHLHQPAPQRISNAITNRRPLIFLPPITHPYSGFCGGRALHSSAARQQQLCRIVFVCPGWGSQFWLLPDLRNYRGFTDWSGSGLRPGFGFGPILVKFR